MIYIIKKIILFAKNVIIHAFHVKIIANLIVLNAIKINYLTEKLMFQTYIAVPVYYSFLIREFYSVKHAIFIVRLVQTKNLISV